MGKTIDTLIKSNKKKAGERWYPISVDSFRNGFIAMSSDVEGYHPLVDNLAYHLQYIQFLEKKMEELELSSVLYTMLVKTLTL